jgi:hypothetical protein
LNAIQVLFQLSYSPLCFYYSKQKPDGLSSRDAANFSGWDLTAKRRNLRDSDLIPGRLLELNMDPWDCWPVFHIVFPA